MILRSVEDCRGFLRGRSCIKSSIRRPWRGRLDCLQKHARLAKVRELVDVDPEICVWEQKVASLSKEFNEQVSNNASERMRYLSRKTGRSLVTRLR